MTGETDPKHHFCPPLREPVPAPMKGDMTPTEERVIRTFLAGIPPMQCFAGRISGGEYVLSVGYGSHRQDVRDPSLIGALAKVQRLHTDLHPAQEAA